MDSHPEVSDEQKQKLKDLQSELTKKAEEMHEMIEDKEHTKEKTRSMFAELQEKALNK
jgi:hypothetical protein